MGKPNEYDIEEAFRVIEEELLASLKKRLEKGLTDESIAKGYPIWQAEQLKALQQYRFTDDVRFKRRYSKLNDEIREFLQTISDDAHYAQVKDILQKSSGEKEYVDNVSDLRLLDDRKMEVLLDSTISDFEKAEYATLRRMDDVYRKTIFNAQMYLSTGSGTLRNAIDMATKDFYATGINSVQYKNGANVNITSYSEMALRTANKRAKLQGEARARDEYGEYLVYVKKRGTACPRCGRFLGRVCIDDVFGNGKPDGKHPLLSTFMQGGLYHPNCKDTHTTYYEGITETPSKITKAEQKEAERIYALEQRQRYNERQIRKYKRLERNLLDPENVKKAKAKRIQWQKEQKRFIDSHEELRRKYDREKIY